MIRLILFITSSHLLTTILATIPLLSVQWPQDDFYSPFPDLPPITRHFSIPGEFDSVKEGDEPPSFYRLPGTTVPEGYDIKLIIDPAAATYTGESKIRIRAVEDTSEIVLHAFTLRIGSLVLRDDRGVAIPTTVSMTDDDRHFLIVTLGGNRTLTKGGWYEIDVPFSHTFSEQPTGLYRNYYLNEAGEKRYFASTQFEPTYARQAFPCYDEPALKAVFNIHIYHPAEYRAITNMDESASERPPIVNFVVTSFHSTPLISPYLIAIVVSDFDYKSNTRDGTVLYPKEFRVWARPETKDSLDYPLDFGQRAFAYLEEYTDVPYRLPKVDNVAVPYFPAGAMENWGLVTYREPYLLYKQGESSFENKMGVALTMTHEFAHFWFGDEVSPLWWDYTWLNEGFATFYQFYASDKVLNGEWRLMEQFTVTQLQGVMAQDAYPTTTPMSNPVGSPTQVQTTFNAIAYSKSGSVIRMMQHILGEDLFREAMSSYLKSLPTGVAEPEILFSEMQKVVQDANVIPSDTIISEVFGSWSNQAGYPVITISPVDATNMLSVTQQRFYYDVARKSSERWWIPFTLTTSRSPSFSTENVTMISPSNKDFSVEVEPNYWYIANLQQSGYYRVMYDAENWKNLMKVLDSENHTDIHPLNKAQIMDDSFVFSRTGRLPHRTSLGLFNYLRNEYDHIPWISAHRGLSFLIYKMPASKNFELYKKFIRDTVSNAFYNVGFETQEDDEQITRVARRVFAEVACEHDDRECWSGARASVLREISGFARVHPDMEFVSYCYSVKGRTRRTWDYLLAEYAKTGDASVDEEEKRTSRARMLLVAMACSDDEQTIERYLNMTISEDSPISKSSHEHVYRYIALYGGEVGVTKTLHFIYDNYFAMKDSFSNENSVAFILYTLASVSVTKEQIETFENIVSTYDNYFSAYERNVANYGRLIIRRNRAWVAKNMDDIDTWLAEKYSTTNNIPNIN